MSRLRERTTAKLLIAIIILSIFVAISTIKVEASADLNQLTSVEDGLFNRYPTWSPDGTKIAYDQEDRVAEPETYTIYVMAADGSDAPGTFICSDAGDFTHSSPAWSPDGEWIAYGKFFYGIYKSKSDGSGDEIQIAAISDGCTQRLSWSSDDRIAYGRLNGIFVIDADGSNQIQLTDGGYSPAWSPDCSKIAYVVGEDIWIVDVISKAVTQLTATSDYEFNPWWSPDGNRIVYSERSVLGSYIYMMDIDGTNKIQLTSDPEYYDSKPCWSPDGTKIAFTRGKSGINKDDIWVLTLLQKEVWVDNSFTPGELDSTHFVSIQEGINSVPEDGTVFVADGAYTGDIEVTVPGITIKGESLGAILTGGFNLQADDITIDGLTIDGRLSWKKSCIYTEFSGSPTVGSKGHTIINNDIIGPDEFDSGIWAILILPTAPEPPNVLIDSNKIHGFRIAILLDDADGNTITNNEIYDNMRGIELEKANDNVIMCNDIHDNSQFACQELGVYSKIGYGVGCPSGTLVGNSVNYNNIYDNDFGIVWLGDSELDANLNWWGDPSGSSGGGAGTGDSVSTNVDYEPWLTGLGD